MNLNELRDEAYSIAKANGWHEEEHRSGQGEHARRCGSFQEVRDGVGLQGELRAANQKQCGR